MPARRAADVPLRRRARATIPAADFIQSGIEVTGFGSNPGALKMFTYLPDTLRNPAPLVVVMHGCNQNAADYLAQSGWREAADADGFLLLLPEQRSVNHPTRCLNFAERLDSIRDSGEALSIRQMVAHAAGRHAVDADRVFVTGLSAGGGMTSVMLATYPDVFAAGAIVAGLPYRCGDSTFTAPAACGVTLSFGPHNPAPNRTAADWGGRVRAAAPPGFAGPWPRVSIWQGEADGTVDPPNATELVEQWTDVHGVDAVVDAEEPVGPAVRATFVGADGRTRVELVTIPGFGHATPIDPDAAGAPCGRAGPFILDADVCSTAEIARFFGLTGQPPSITIDIFRRHWGRDRRHWRRRGRGRCGRRGVGPPRRRHSTVAPAGHRNRDVERPLRRAAAQPLLPARSPSRPTPTARPRLRAARRWRSARRRRTSRRRSAIDDVRVAGACVAVEGSATDDLGPVAEVAVTIGAHAPETATILGDDFAFEKCGLPDGAHPVEVTATDVLGATATVSGPPATVAARVAARGTWLDHLREGRLRTYASPCPSVGFGTCDAAFAAIHGAHGFADFELFRAAASNDWFVDPGNIP